MVDNMNFSVINTFVENNKFVGFIIQSSDGETKYLNTKDYQQLLKNLGKKISVRFPNESVYEDINIDLEKFTISNEFAHEYFGWYDGSAIALKK